VQSLSLLVMCWEVVSLMFCLASLFGRANLAADRKFVFQ